MLVITVETNKKQKQIKMEKQLIYFNKREYNRVKHEAQKNLKLLNTFIKESLSVVEQPQTTDEMTKLIQNPINWVYSSLKAKYGDKVGIPVPIEKIISLMGLEGELFRLQDIVKDYKSKNIKAFSDGIGVDVDEEAFKYYTQNEEQNKALNLFKDLIKAYTTLYTETHAIPNLLNISQGKLILDNGELYPLPRFIYTF